MGQWPSNASVLLKIQSYIAAARNRDSITNRLCRKVYFYTLLWSVVAGHAAVTDTEQLDGLIALQSMAGQKVTSVV